MQATDPALGEHKSLLRSLSHSGACEISSLSLVEKLHFSLLKDELSFKGVHLKPIS